MLRLWEGWALRLRARGRRFSSCGELGQPHPNRSYGSRRDSWQEGARTEADEEGGYRSPEKTNQILMPVLQSSVLSKRFSLSSGSNRSRRTKGEGSRKKPMPTQSRRKKPVQRGPTVQDEEGLDCHEKGLTVQGEGGLDCHKEGPTVQGEEGPDCQEQIVPDQKRSPKAACRARRMHRQNRQEGRATSRRSTSQPSQPHG
jgi:hypothetical protein